MKVDPGPVNANDQSAVNLFVLLSQSSSCDDARYLLSQLNTSNYIGLVHWPIKLVRNFKV